MRKSADVEAREVTDYVQSRLPAALGPIVYDVKEPFLDGKLYTVNFDINDHEVPGQTLKKMSRVYVRGSFKELYLNDELLLTIVGRNSKKGMFERLTSPEGIAALIALIMTVVVCYMSLNNVSIPALISNALTIILGFYFGQATKKSEN